MKVPTISKDKIIAIYKILYDFERFCNDFDIEYWAEGGTLIGAIRHKGLIPWDDDIDVQTDANNYNKLLKYQDQLFAYNLGIVFETDFGNLMKIIRPLNKPISKDKYWSFPFIDVFKMKKRGPNFYYASPEWRELRGGKVKVNEVYPLRKAKFGHYTIPVPNKSKDIIINNYGKDALSLAYFEGFHSEDQDDEFEYGQRIAITKFTPAKPFYVHKPAKKGFTEGGIPKIIHQIWIGGTPSPGVSIVMSSWLNLKDWKYKIWSNGDLTKKNFPLTWSTITRVQNYAMKSGNINSRLAQITDIMRLEILYSHGGLYVDSTFELLRDITPLFNSSDRTFVVSNEEDCGFECFNENGRFISNSFIASTKKNPILKNMLAPKILNKIKLKERINVSTGPYFLGKYLPDEGMTMLPTIYIYPEEPDGKKNKCYSEKKFKGANIKVGDNYMMYPCLKYPESYLNKVWEMGGTWLKK